MTVEILKDDIQIPAQSNLTWVFGVRLNGRGPIPWKVDSFDLGVWFKEAVGRFPGNEKGDKQEKEDILENWSLVEPRLRLEAEKEAELPVKVSVDGMRFSARHSEEARLTPKEELPPLSVPQREAAKSMGTSEEAYQRNLLVGERTWNDLLEKTKRLADFLERRLEVVAKEARLESVVLRTFEEKFDVEIRFRGEPVHFFVRESVVDDLFETGSEHAENSLARVLDLALPRQAAR